MPLRKLAENFHDFAFDRALAEASRPLEELLASGGDGRLALNADQRNAYGCTPFPRPGILDFGSSTASSISERGHARAQAARARLWLTAAPDGTEARFDDDVEGARDALRLYLGVGDAEIVFSPSGTDAQLQALFLVKALLGGPLATIIVGADQTGSGTAHTARGHHFSDQTCQGAGVEKGAPIRGLCEGVRTVSLGFCDGAGQLRSDDEMDAAVEEAVEDAISRGEKVLLQIMDASKLGWRGPSAACVAAMAETWPDRLRIVVDACQMRLGRPQLREYLERGYFVLLTGSKFFTGPAFSGGLLVPRVLADAIARLRLSPLCLSGYSARHDWPRSWKGLRQALPAMPNYGQWLRWEATLEEMKNYYAVPPAFRRDLLAALADALPRLIGASPNLELLTEQCGAPDAALSDEMQHRTIHSFVPQRNGMALPLKDCAALYRAMGRDLSHLLADETGIAARICQIGQPVALGHRPGAVLRLCVSARLVSDCWAATGSVEEALASVLEDARTVMEKFDWLIAHPELCESPA